MAKKDAKIEERLIGYVESVKPSEERILKGAIFAMRTENQISSGPVNKPSFLKRKRTLTFTGVAAAFLVFVTVLISQLLPASPSESPGPEKPPPNAIQYSLSDLTAHEAALSDIQADKTVLTLNFAANAETAAQIYLGETDGQSGGTPSVISVRYKTVGSGGLDDILVVADLKKGLSDYESFQTLATLSLNGVQVHFNEVRENGEYYTNAYFNSGGVDYYVLVMSPVKDAGYAYVQKLLNK